LWSFPLNFFVSQIAGQYHVVHEGLSKPWEHLTAFVSNLEIKLEAFETIYVVWGAVSEVGRAAETEEGAGAKCFCI
jgi:hypothetical protein